MNAERYIRQATRGLWGQHKKDAQAELRGAIEDKIYRYTLLGFDEKAALNAALRNLGSPGVIARELTSIHTLPPAVKFTVLAGLTGLLSFQAAAKTYVVNAAPAPVEVMRASCDLSPQRLASLDKDYQKYAQGQIQQFGSRSKAEAACRNTMPNPVRFISIPDLNAALEASGFKVFRDEMWPGRVAVDFSHNGNWTTLLDGSFNPSGTINKQLYVDGSWLLVNLRQNTALPLSLRGATNPVLTVGPMKVQLGTKTHPLQSAELLLPLAAQALEKSLSPQAPASAAFAGVGWMNGLSEGRPLNVPGPDGTLYAMLRNQPLCNCAEEREESKYLLMSLHAAQQGKIHIPTQIIPHANTEAEFFKFRATGVNAYLLYKIDTSDLRNVKFTLVPQVWK